MGARVPAVPNLKSLAFGPVQLSRYLQSLEDDFGPRFATHEFWGRDGGLEEYGGQRQLRTKVRLRIPGASWRAALAETLEPMLATPRNVLTHPVYGRKKMVIKSPVRGSMDFVREGACYAVELLFVEAAADVRLSSGASGVSAAAARTTAEREESGMRSSVECRRSSQCPRSQGARLGWCGSDPAQEGSSCPVSTPTSPPLSATPRSSV